MPYTHILNLSSAVFNSHPYRNE